VYVYGEECVYGEEWIKEETTANHQFRKGKGTRASLVSLQFFSRFGVKGHESGQPQAFGCMQVSCSIENRGENLGCRNGSSGGWSTFDKERENDKIVGRGHPMWG
jgi:hypothetical protein